MRWTCRKTKRIALRDTDQAHCIARHCNYAPQWLQCRHSIPIITSDSQTHIFIACVACRQFSHASPDGCQLSAEWKKKSVWMKSVPSRLKTEYRFESFETRRVRVSGLNCLTKVTKKNACFRQRFCQDGWRNVPAWLLEHHFNIFHAFKRSPGSP